MVKITELPEFLGEVPTGNSSPISSAGTTYRIELGTAAKKASSFLVDRTNHTGSQSIGTITNLQTTLDGKSNLVGGNTFTGTQVFSDALTFNGTTYTYGTGAAAAHKTALSLGNVDNTSDLNKPISTATQTALDTKRISTDSKLVSVIEECFVGGWLDAAGQVYGNGSLSWLTKKSGTSGIASTYSLTGNPSCPIFQAQSGAHWAALPSLGMNSVSNMIGCSFEWKFRPTGGATSRYFFGFRDYVGAAGVETSMRGLFVDLVAGDTEWQCLHQTTAGVQTKVSTGKAYAANQWVNAKITIVSTTETDITISTSGSQTPVTTRITGGYDFSSFAAMGWKFSSTDATLVYLYMARFVATLVRTEF